MDDFPICAKHLWNTITHGPCCQCMTSNEKIAYVWNQLRTMWAKNEHQPLMCPYCLTVTPVDAQVCCKTLKRCIRALVDRENAMDELTEKANRN